MKDWKTTLLGILGAALLLATVKGYIDKEISAFLGSVIIIIFGKTASDSKIKSIIGGSTPPKDKDEK